MPVTGVPTPNLEQIYGQGPMSGYLGMDQYMTAQKNNQINQQETLEDMMRKQQMHPLEMDSKRADTSYKQAQTGLVGEQTRGAQFTNDMNRDTRDAQYKAHVAKYAREASDDDLKSMENSIQQLGYSNDPKSREIAKMLMQFKYDLVKARELDTGRQENRLAVEELKNRGRLEAEALKARTRKELDGAKAGKDPKNLLELATRYKLQADVLEDDDPRKGVLLDRANELLQAHSDMQVRSRAAGNGGKIDMPAVAGLPSTDIPSAPQLGGGGAASAPQPKPKEMTVQKLQEMYPGVPPAKLKELYKKKFGVDIK